MGEKTGASPFSRPQIKSVRISAAAMEEVIPISESRLLHKPPAIFTEQANIRDLIMRHAVLRRPTVYGLAGWIKHLCTLHQLLKIAALSIFARACSRPAKE
mgnify:CR=1 FL=1